METPWGEIAVRDAHVHFFSHGFFSALARMKGDWSPHQVAAATGWEAPPEDADQLADRWDHELDRNGVTSAALLASVPGDEASVLAAVQRHPRRFHGYFFVNPLADSAERRVADGLSAGLRGVCLFPAMHCYSMHDEHALKIVQLAAGTPGSVVFVHCGVLTVGIRKKLGLPSPFDMRYSNPVDLHGIALRFPHLPFVVPHFGAGYFREALMLADLCPNVYLDTSSSNKWMKYEPEHLTLRRVFEKALDVLGPSRLLFGTDSSNFPRGWNAAVYHDQVHVLRELGVSAGDAAMILGDNLGRLLRAHGADDRT